MSILLFNLEDKTAVTIIEREGEFPERDPYSGLDRESVHNQLQGCVLRHGVRVSVHRDGPGGGRGFAAADPEELQPGNVK